jgi:hypothetical protein
MNTTGTVTGIERKASEDDIANKRKPRTFSSANLTVSNKTPYHLDFCQWLQSESFGNNRRLLLLTSGATWLAGMVN